MAEGYTDRLLDLVITEGQRARDTTDPIDRAQLIALVQRYAGWALHWAATDARQAGVSWSRFAAAIGVAQDTTVQRQHAAHGPVSVIRPFHQAGTRNDDGQTPLRQAATRLAHEMFPTAALQGSPTGVALYLPVEAMASAMTSAAAQPLLATVRHVLTVAEGLVTRDGYPAAASFAQERAVWTALGDLRTVYERDMTLIEVADAARHAAETSNETGTTTAPAG